MNYRTLQANSGHQHPKRLKAGRRVPTKAKYTYYDVLRQADASPDNSDKGPQDVTLRSYPRQNTGTVIDGQFITFRDANGRLVFIGENGQMVRK